MPDRKIQFRCFQCNKLLGISRSKAGAVVACPKCGAELIVPDPDEPGATAPAMPDASSPSSVATGAASSEFGPEAIRTAVGPGSGPGSESQTSSSGFQWPAAEPDPALVPAVGPPMPVIHPELSAREAEALPSRVADEGSPFPAIQMEPIALRPEASPRGSPPRSRAESEPPAIAPIVAALAAEPVSLRDEPSVVGPVRATSARRSDVILPGTVVVLWSFLVLLAVVLAFASGLLAGHYVWK